MTTFLQDLINAINLGSLYALYAVGISLIFGIMRLINFAHFSLIMIGGYVVVESSELPLVLRIALAIIACVVSAIILEFTIFRSSRGANATTLLVTSFAVSFVLKSLAQMVFGPVPRSTTIHPWLNNSFTIGELYIPRINLVTLVVVGTLFLGLTILLQGTRIGLQMRASAEDFSTSRLLGVRANRVIRVAFAMSGVFAAVASILLLGISGQVSPTFGLNAVLFGLVAAVVGGLNSVRGSVLGGYTLGMLSQVLQRFLPSDLRSFRDAFLFGGVFLFLVFRPQGIIVKGDGARI